MDVQAQPHLHPLLSGRFSPSSFDATHVLDDPALTALLDAARWAPSAGNSQPWGFLPARRGDDDHRRVVPHLAPSSAAWALDASALVVTAARLWVDDDIAYSEFADYDLGQAVAHLTIQAQAMGLACHQFRAFDLDGLTACLAPDYGWTIRSIIAVGKGVGSRADRRRRSVADVTGDPWLTRAP
ncbi:nitroreductase [Gordonia sp. TBRC 11910]|uniref:Nitroreductase n=1 Tax=Gordonia asplenii TaxID=2725283 RepID=A0A848KXT3_9ACTN|nr:nitroreductase family protein [Gordonia asplenii]NMO00268.1 nitroreductase [Gordonia asplenii]